jgi:hypothetical protein
MSMTTQNKLSELRSLEMKLSARYLFLFKLFLIITIILIILIVIDVIGIVFLGLGNNWALLTFEGWMVGLSSLVGIFILLEIMFYIHYYLIRKNRLELEKPKPEMKDGKKVYDITLPRGTDGGVFSKTYIEIDNKNIIRLKNLMIPPDEL